MAIIFSRRTSLILLCCLLLLSLIVRYPLVEHERYQTDSYFIHHLADTISVEGYASWTFHPLSYVGYYPLSYPSGVPFLLAECSELTGLDVSVSILIMNLAIAVIFCLAVFAMAKHFLPRMEFAILATFFATLGSRFIDTSYWDGSARGPVVAVITLLAMTFFGWRAYGRRRLVLVGSMLGIGCFFMHHMAVLLMLFGMAYLISVFEADVIFERFSIYGKRVVMSIAVVIAIIVIATPFLIFDYFWESAIRGLQGSELFTSESTFVTVILTASTSYTNQIGFILLFAIAYIPIMVKRPRLALRDILPVIVVIAFLPIFGETLYVSMVLSPFIAILGALWFVHSLRNPARRKHVLTTLSVLMVVSLALPFWSTDRWNSETFASGDTVSVGHQIFNDAQYSMDCFFDQSAICNVIPIRARMEALSRVDFLGSGILLALNGDISEEDVREGIRQSSAKFPKNIYSWFEYEQEPPVSSYVRDFMIHGTPYLDIAYGIGGGSEYFSKHSRLIVVIDNRWHSEYLTTATVLDAKLPGELFSSESAVAEYNSDSLCGFCSYVTYRSSLVSICLTQLPTAEPSI